MYALEKTGIMNLSQFERKVADLVYSSITEELLKQFNQLPLEFQKKLLEYARVLNAAIKGKPGKDLPEFAGTIDQDSLKAMEEAVAYGKMKVNSNIAKIEQEVSNLSLRDQLELIEKIINLIKEEKCKDSEADFSWDQFYGISKGLWQEDAQEYVGRLREDR